MSKVRNFLQCLACVFVTTLSACNQGGDNGNQGGNGVNITVSPTATTLAPAASASFTATVTGSSTTAVSWSASCGTVTGTTNTVSYTAPGSADTCTLTATSQADSSKTAAATITVLESGSTAAIWTSQFAPEANDLAYEVAVDGRGNVHVAGTTFGSLEGNNAGLADAFVRKYDAAGTILWTRQFGTNGDDIAYAVAADNNGNVLVAGTTFGDLEGGRTTTVDAFVRKYDANGTVLWTRQFGTATIDDATSVAVDNNGNVFVAGATRGDLEGPNAGFVDAFVRKYDANGNSLWTRQFGTGASLPSGSVGIDFISAVAVDSTGSVLVAGETQGQIGSNALGQSDAFVRKYDTSGNELWTQQFGTSTADFAKAVAVDSSDNIVVGGHTSGDLEGKNAGVTDIFIRTFDAGGNVLSTKQFGTAQEDYTFDVVVDSADNVLVTGETLGDFFAPTVSRSDTFTRKYNAAGAEVWTQQFGTEGDDRAEAVAVDSSSNVLVVGTTAGNLENGSPNSNTDAFVRKFRP
jgi:hypothetical protein